MLELDAVLFEQALFNLLDNAAKYAPAGTTIRIRGWRDKDFVCLQILDEGDGIPPDDLEHIFDKFYRVQKGRSGAGRHRARSCDFPRVRRGHERHHHRCEPDAIARARCSRSGCRFRRRQSNWTPPHERRARSKFW